MGLTRVFAKYPSLRPLLRHYRSTSAILGAIFRSQLSVEDSRRIIQDRLEHRRENFCEVVEKAIFAVPGSPYRALLQRAGYELGDVIRLVQSLGIEGTLGELHSRGVYIDILEFKGKKDVVRGEDTFRFREKDFSNPLLSDGLGTRSGGTRSAGTEMVVPLEYIRQHNPYNVLASHACRIIENPVVIWLPILPAGEGLFFNLRFAAMGNPPVKWFSQVDEKYIKPSMMDRLKTRSTIWMGVLHGKRMPGPEFVDINRTFEVARWMENTLDRPGGSPLSPTPVRP